MATNNGTSLLEQTDAKKKKWGSDPHNYDIQGAIKNYDTNLAKYNDVNTSQDEKNAINAQYGGDITKWNNKTAYDDYMADMKYIDYVDTLNKGYNAMVDSAKNAESQKMQYADTRRQLMQKYLPETLMAQGVANTGYTADALLKAENNYNQYVMGAVNDRANAEKDAMQSYRDALGQFKQEQNEEAYQRFLNAENEQKGIMDTMSTAAMEGLIENREQAEEYLNIAGADERTKQQFLDYYDKKYPAKTEEEGTGSTVEVKENSFISTDKGDYSAYAASKSDLGMGALQNHRDFNPTSGDVFSLQYHDAEGNAQVGKLKMVGNAINGSTTDGPLRAAFEYVKDTKVDAGVVYMYNGALYVVGKVDGDGKPTEVYKIKESRAYDDVKAGLMAGYQNQANK